MRMTGDFRVDGPVISRATAELGMALNEIGKAASLTHIVTVYDRAMHRMLMRCGCAGEPLGPPQMIGGVEMLGRASLRSWGWSGMRASGRLAGLSGLSLEPAIVEKMRSEARLVTGLRFRLSEEANGWMHMIRFITRENFALLDAEIEQAYRRRCDANARTQRCPCLRNIEDVARLRVGARFEAARG